MRTRADVAPRTLSLRRLLSFSTIGVVVVSILVVAALFWSSVLLQRSILTVGRDSEARSIASELELSTLTYQRLSNLYELTGEAELGEARLEVVSEMGRLLARARGYAETDADQQQIDQVGRDLMSYVQERQRQELRGLDQDQIVRLTQAELTDVLSGVEAIREKNGADVRNAQSDALRVSRLTGLIALAGGGVIAIALIGVAFVVRRYVLEPIIEIDRMMLRFIEGDSAARVGQKAMAEIDEISRSFNLMADNLGRQRQDQLAFLAGIAHDLRDPLSALRLGIYSLQTEQSTARRGRTRERLDHQVDRLSRMVEDLLDATQVEAGNMELRREVFDLRDAVDDTIRLLYAPTSPDHPIRTDLPEEPVIVKADPIRIEQVISNLLSNAIKFSPKGGPIEVTIKEEQDEAVLAVTDRGIGLSREDLPTIFLPFERRRSYVAPGIGLGLSVTRRIVAAHGGRIEVDSRPGEGSTFRVRIPFGLDPRAWSAVVPKEDRRPSDSAGSPVGAAPKLAGQE